MNRREYTKRVLAFTLTAPAILTGKSAYASQDQLRRGERRNQLVLSLEQGKTRIDELVLISPQINTAYSIRLKGALSRYSERQTNLENTPIIGGLLRPSLSDRLAGSRKIGGVYQSGRKLFAEFDPNLLSQINKTIIINGAFSWETRKDPVPYVKDIPLIGSLFRHGDVRHKNRELLILVRPTIVDSEY